MAKKDDWTRGYLCAVANLIRSEGVVNTAVRTLLEAAGAVDFADADPEDRVVFEQHGVATTR